MDALRLAPVRSTARRQAVDTQMSADESEDFTPVAPLTDEQKSRLKSVALDRACRAEDHSWRPHVFEGMFRHLPVAEGEMWAAGFAPTTIRSVPGMAERFEKSVPDGYVAVDLNDDGFSAAQIACPCGEVHEVEIGTVIVAPCDRAFSWFGRDVRVARFDAEDGSPD